MVAVAQPLAEQSLTALGTLAVAAAAFYFGSRSVQTARGATVADAPAVTGLTPREAKRGGTATTTISGRGFQEDAAVELRHKDQRLNVVSVTFLRGSAITIEVSIEGDAPEQELDVMVTNPNGEKATLPRAFRVVA